MAALNSPERGQVLRGVLEAEGQLQQRKILDPYTLSMIDKAATSDLYRQAAGAQLRAALEQGVQGMNQAQVGAQALAQESNRALMNAASTRGGYV